MTPEEQKRRAEDEHVKYIREHVCDKDKKKPYVFISYKSDDWEVVLHDVVYRLVKEYGLNVYFDGSFDTHNALWTSQFPENMGSYNCRGVLAFIDNKYATSYATLLELMYSQTKKLEKKVIPVNLDALTIIDGEEGERDTGLGVVDFKDGTRNVNAETEAELFNDAFKQLLRRKILVDAEDWYKPGQKLSKRDCSEIVSELLGRLKINENPYKKSNGSLEGIVGSIRDACGDDVFHKSSSSAKPEKVTVSSKNDEKSQKVEVEKPKPSVLPASPASEPILSGKSLKEYTLKEFGELCEYPEICKELRKIRETEKKQYFDYLMAALLRGCDEAAFKNSKGTELVTNHARWNYCTYAVSRTLNPDAPKCGASQFTWTSNARKAVGIEGAGKLGESSSAFEKLGEDVTLGQIEKYFTDAAAPAFITRDNPLVLKALHAILQMDVKEILGRIGL